jgi:hypothetical protein
MHYQPDCVHPVLTADEAHAAVQDPRCYLVVVRRDEESKLRLGRAWIRLDSPTVKDASFYVHRARERAA